MQPCQSSNAAASRRKTLFETVGGKMWMGKVGEKWAWVVLQWFVWLVRWCHIFGEILVCKLWQNLAKYLASSVLKRDGDKPASPPAKETARWVRERERARVGHVSVLWSVCRRRILRSALLFAAISFARSAPSWRFLKPWLGSLQSPTVRESAMYWSKTTYII